MTASKGLLRRSAGVSLVEALVALAVMAFGMLGMAGIQSTLRANSDIARQRAEAVRIAQETIERARSYTVLPTVGSPVPNHVYFDSLSSVAPTTVTGYTTNTTYTRTVTVASATGPRYKTFVVDVAWRDRTDTAQSVRLATAIHRSPPELAAALTISGDGTVPRLPEGRSPSIPRGAVDQGDGTSRFNPPGAGTISWIFSNTSGLITSRCDSSTCVAVTARLLAGFVGFATNPTQPGAVDAETPTSAVIPGVGVALTQTFPSSGVPAPECFTQTLSSPPALAYLCLIHVLPASSPGLAWSGGLTLAGLPVASSIADPNSAAFRVCRYTTYRTNVAVGSTDSSVDPATGQPRMPVGVTLQNYDHPLIHTNVDRSFLNQSFLVIRAGNGTTAFSCPADDVVATPFINTNTFDHQPSS